MKHPDERVLQCYLDGQLTAAQAREVQTHLAICSPCRCQAQSSVAVSRAVRTLCPDARAFGAPDEFWLRLSAALGRAPRRTWSWLTLLPPLSLGLLATGLRLILGLLGVAYLMQVAGVVAPIGTGLAEDAADALVLPQVQYAAYFVGGWSTDEVYRDVTTLWGQLESLTRNSAGFWFVLILFHIALSIVSALYLAWSLFWARGARRGEGG